MSEAQRERQPLLAQDIETTAVYPVIHMIRQDIMHYIDTPLTYDALMAPDLTYTLVRPLEDKYNAIQTQGNKSVVFCFLLNRVHFLRDHNITTAPLSKSRAASARFLRYGHSVHMAPGDNTLQLTLAVTTSWPVYAGADREVLVMIQEEHDDADDRVGNAIEMAIIGQAKRFIKSSACQKVIDSIWSGKCVYQAFSNHTILSDTYKRTPIHFYDPHKAPLLDHYRLKVPAIRSVLEYLNFLILFSLFIWALEKNEEARLNVAEVAFMVYGLGFALEKVAAMQEHGMRVYFTGTWNGFDLAFVTVFCSYATLRLYGIFHDNHWARHNGVDCLALIAVLLFPRLAFVTLRNNLMVLSLRAMMLQFVVLMLIAAFCFGGFLYALWTFSRNRSAYPVGQIAWWMLDLWFGLDASGFDRADQFHPVFGPILIVTYACLSNTLLLTVLVSILSHTFSTISEDAAAEAMFRRAVSTIEGVKADPLFSYQPPVNVIALLIMFPASYVLSPRWFHKLNVTMIRLTNFPILLVIAWYERQAKRTGTSGFYETVSAAAEKVFDTLPRSMSVSVSAFFEGLAGSGADIDAIFDIEDERNCAVSDTEDLSPREGLPMREAGRPPGSQHDHARDSWPFPSTEGPQPYKPEDPTNGSGQPQQRHQDDEPSPPSPHPSWSQSPTPPPRHRATSILTRVENVANSALVSPLAQVFQPFTIDVESTIPEEGAPEGSPAGAAVALSYGPATRRRRLSSMHRRTAGTGDREPVVSGTPGQVAGRRIPIPGQPGSRHGSVASSPFIESPVPDPHLLSPPETATQVEEEEGTGSGGSKLVAKRLAQIEERQKRIEDLLIRMADSK